MTDRPTIRPTDRRLADRVIEKLHLILVSLEILSKFFNLLGRFISSAAADHQRDVRGGEDLLHPPADLPGQGLDGLLEAGVCGRPS